MGGAKGRYACFGHRNALDAVRDTTETAARIGVKAITLYAFSTENWSRPADEVNALMELLVNTIADEIPTLHKNNTRLAAIGDIDSLPTKCAQKLRDAITETATNTGLTLCLALSYSGRWELKEAMKAIADKVAQGAVKTEEISLELISAHLHTKDMPDPELLIRTSGEMRISNFLLWQMAYTELFFTEVLWPDFRKEHLYEAIVDFQKRERRFGKTSAQLKS